MNSCLISGNFTADPDYKLLANNTPVCEFTVAVNERYKSGDEWKEKTHFIRCKAWRWLAEKIGDMAHKGDGCVVHGSLEQDTWEDKETGKKQSKTLVNVREFELTRRAAKREDAKPKETVAAKAVDPLDPDDELGDSPF